MKRIVLARPTQLIPAPEEVQSFADIQQTGRINVHCPADKIFKWSKLGELVLISHSGNFGSRIF
ncbi:unnamed protein product [Strongylus vulgaris]|uniref:Uncharacterized protein n=1 Tax=Strongylus vulgaris TaxID=40348 RepID=A0A3P7L2D5_STRVU|nr:unnamed protein product [Strongylus vulgaris]